MEISLDFQYATLIEGDILVNLNPVKIHNPQGTPPAANLNLLHLLDFNIHYQVVF